MKDVNFMRNDDVLGRFFTGRAPWAVFIWILLFLLLPLGCQAGKSGREGGKASPGKGGQYGVLIVKSPASLGFWGWKGEQDLQAAADTLHRLGVSCAFVDEAQLASGELPCRVLLLANTRCMHPEAIEGIRKFLGRGGKLLATYMSGYRDHNNQMAGRENNFILAPEYGVDFYSWAQGKPGCEYMKTVSGQMIQLGRNQGMLVKPRPGTEVLSLWCNDKGAVQKAGGVEMPAVTFNEKTGVIFCSEDLFAPENSSSSQVAAYAGNLLERLAPGIVTSPLSGKEGQVPPGLAIPEEIQKAVKPGGQVVRVGFKDPWDDVFVSCPGKGVFKSSGELYSISRSGKYSKTVAVGEIEASPGALYRLRCVSTQGKAPYVNIYTAKGVLAGRSVDRLTFGPRQAGVPVMVYDLKPNGTYSFNAYRGSMEFSPSVPGKLLPGNVLTLEEYLAGVVPSEMPASYPEEALKAMAVVARTFASSLVQDGKHKKEGFDVCNYVHCQVYGGILKERHSASRAIAATRGMVARYRGKFPNTTFHATNGGFGARAVSVWSFDTPYLQGGFDGPGEFTKDLSREENLKEFIDNPPPCYDSKAGRFRWKESFAVKDLEKLLAESLGKGGQVETGTLQSIRVTSRSADGRAQELEVVMSGGVFRPKKDSMRWITSGGKIGTGGLQSTLFYVTREGDRITFHGGGWGHGVGLSQEGARGRAEAGHKYDEIIKAYYQGVEITGDY